MLSRAGVGVAEAAIMTCCTTLIADYFSGTERDRWLGLQTVFASAVGHASSSPLGGGLGAISWRTPFWLYASSLVFAVLAAALLWQPAAVRRRPPTARTALPPVPVARAAAAVPVTLFGGVVFYTPIVELPFVLDAAGVTAVSAIGASPRSPRPRPRPAPSPSAGSSRRGTATLLPSPSAWPASGWYLGLGATVAGASSSARSSPRPAPA